MHDLLMRQVAVGEDDLVDPSRAADRIEFRLFDNSDAIRIKSTGELRRIAAPRNSGDLSRREGDDLARRIIAKDHIIVMEIATRGAEDDDVPTMLGGAGRVQPRFRCNKS